MAGGALEEPTTPEYEDEKADLEASGAAPADEEGLEGLDLGGEEE